MSNTYLNDSNFSYIWGKIKAYIDSLISTVNYSREGFGYSIEMNNNVVDLSQGDVFIKTISANTTFTFTGVPESRTATFSMILTNAGSYTITWPSSVKWSYGDQPILSTTGIDMITFLTPDGGITWYGSLSVENAQNSL